MTEFDKAYMAERRKEHYRDLRETMDREHRRGLNTNPYYGWTQAEISRHEASLNADWQEDGAQEEE